MTTKLVSAFPGTGKTYFASQCDERLLVTDLDTGIYTKGYDKAGRVRSAEFPNNYVTAIKSHLGKADILFVGCQPEVLDALRSEGLSFTLIYPDRKLKPQYIQRYVDRQSPPEFTNLLSDRWEVFLNFLESQRDCEHIVLGDKQYVSDVVESLAI